MPTFEQELAEIDAELLVLEDSYRMLEALALADGEIDADEAAGLKDLETKIKAAKRERRMLIDEEADADAAKQAADDREQTEQTRDEIWEPTVTNVAKVAAEEQAAIEDYVDGLFTEPAEEVDPADFDPDCPPGHHAPDAPAIDPDIPHYTDLEEILETEQKLAEVRERQLDLQIELLKDPENADQILAAMEKAQGDFDSIAGAKTEQQAARALARARSLDLKVELTDALRETVDRLRDLAARPFLSEATLEALHYEIGRLDGEIGARNMNAQFVREGAEKHERLALPDPSEMDGYYAAKTGAMLGEDQLLAAQMANLMLDVMEGGAGLSDGLQVGYAAEFPQGADRPTFEIEDMGRFAFGFGSAYGVGQAKFLDSIVEDVKAIVSKVASEVASGELFVDDVEAAVEAAERAAKVLAKLRKSPYDSGSQLGELAGAVLAGAAEEFAAKSDFEKGRILGAGAGYAVAVIVGNILLNSLSSGAFAALKGAGSAARLAASARIAKGASKSFEFANKIADKILRKLRESALVRQLDGDLLRPPSSGTPAANTAGRYPGGSKPKAPGGSPYRSDPGPDSWERPPTDWDRYVDDPHKPPGKSKPSEYSSAHKGPSKQKMEEEASLERALADFIAAGGDIKKIPKKELLHGHHLLPQEFIEYFASPPRNIDIHKYIVPLTDEVHLKHVHGGAKDGGLWNKEWADWIDKHPDAEADAVLAKMQQMKKSFEIAKGQKHSLE